MADATAFSSCRFARRDSLTVKQKVKNDGRGSVENGLSRGRETEKESDREGSDVTKRVMLAGARFLYICRDPGFRQG